MTLNAITIRKMSFSLSLLLHLLVLIIFFFIKITLDYNTHDFVEIGFGDIGLSGSAGSPGSEIYQTDNTQTEQATEESAQKNEEVKDIELPVTKHSSEDNLVVASEKSDKNKQTNVSNPSDNAMDRNAVSRGNKSAGDGSFGYDIDWGGRGKRRIYSYVLPEYPAGVNKEIDIRLRFSILPDGTVGTIFPLTKADTRLEDVAMNSLRRWKFEPLSAGQKQVEQTAVIVFPYRLQ